jgi:hypothetical protein
VRSARPFYFITWSHQVLNIFESPIVPLVVGLLAATFALVVFLGRRTMGSLVALGVVLVATLLMVLVERLVVTDREQIEYAIDEVLARVEANDVAGVVAWIDPAEPRVVADVRQLMPMIKVEKARTTSKVEVGIGADSPDSATSTFRGFLDGVHKSSGMRVGFFNQRIDVFWKRREGRWLVTDYQAYFDDNPIDAVGSARGNRPVPTKFGAPARDQSGWTSRGGRPPLKNRRSGVRRRCSWKPSAPSGSSRPGSGWPKPGP